MEIFTKATMNLSKIVSRLFYSEGSGTGRGFEETRRRSVLSFFLVIGVLTLFPFCIFHFSQGNTWRAVILLFVCSVQATSLILMRYLREVSVVVRPNVILLACYLLFLIVVGGMHGSRMLWIFVFPPFAFYLLGKREGFFWSILTLLASWLLFIDPGTIFGTFSYESGVKVRFSIAYILILLMSYIVETARNRYQVGMEKESLRLQSEIEERLRIEGALRKYRDELEDRVSQRTAELRGANEKLKSEIEERKQIERALRAAEEEKEIVLGNLLEHVIHEDPNMRIIWANRAACESVGLTKEEIVGRHCYELWPHSDKPCPDCPVQKAMETGEPKEIEKTTQDEKTWIIRGYPVRNEKREIVGGIEVTLEITEWKRAESSLREAYDIINRSPAVAFLWKNEEGWPVEFVSDNVLSLCGYSAKEFISGEVLYDNVLYHEDLRRVADEVAAYSADKDLETFTHQPYRIVTKSGEVKWVEDNTYIRRDKSGRITHYQGIVEDITEKKIAEEEKERLQAQLLKSQKLEAIGTLAGGIAHDFNNLLMGIQGRTSLLMMDIDADRSQLEHLKGIEEYVRSAADLAGQLLGFARGGKYEVVATDLNELVKRISAMYGRTRKNIVVHTRYEKEIWIVEVEQRQMEQVLLNLFINAWHAMPGGGDIYIQTENTVLDINYVKPYQVKPGRYVKISVTDTGTGMDEATRQRIFDPFFTTKEMGRGTGLGLASSYGIIKNHEGIIDVYSEKGHGTTFNIYLPASDKEVIEKKETPAEILRGTGTVLIVDDEEFILTVGEEMLQRIGYNVLTAKSGEEAVHLYGRERDRIRLVILDMVMPEMDGAETYEQLKQINPGVKVLLSSGYSINGNAQRILDRGCDGFIQKPFNLEDLSRKVIKILG